MKNKLIFLSLLTSIGLSACNTMDNYFYSNNEADREYREYNQKAAHPSTATSDNVSSTATKTSSSEVTKKVDVGTSSVNTQTSTTSAAQQGPAVPNMAPSVSQ